MLRPLKTLVDAQEFPWLPPWLPGRTPRERAVRRLRAHALALLRRADPASPAAFAARCLAWPLLLPVKAWLGSRRSPRLALRLAADLLSRNIRPGALDIIHALRPPGSRHAALFVTDRENQALTGAAIAAAPSAAIRSKRHFARFCRHHGLPAIPVLAEGRGGHVEHLEPWPAADLFVKRDDLWGGKGAAAFAHDPASGRWTGPGGASITPETLGAWAARAHPDADWVLQPRLAADPAWSRWSPGALGTVRVMTLVVRPGEAPELLGACMRHPRAGAVVDNFSSGGLASDLDHRSGVLDRALGKDPRHPWHERHPDTGHPIAGQRVPHWDALAVLALRAHAAAPDLISVGWDLTLHDGQPILVEANPVRNITPWLVLGETRWLEAMLHRFPAASLGVDLPPSMPAN